MTSALAFIKQASVVVNYPDEGKYRENRSVRADEARKRRELEELHLQAAQSPHTHTALGALTGGLAGVAAGYLGGASVPHTLLSGAAGAVLGGATGHAIGTSAADRAKKILEAKMKAHETLMSLR